MSEYKPNTSTQRSAAEQAKRDKWVRRGLLGAVVAAIPGSVLASSHIHPIHLLGGGDQPKDCKVSVSVEKGTNELRSIYPDGQEWSLVMSRLDGMPPQVQVQEPGSAAIFEPVTPGNPVEINVNSARELIIKYNSKGEFSTQCEAVPVAVPAHPNPAAS